MRSKKEKLKIDLLAYSYAFSKKMTMPQPENDFYKNRMKALLISRLYKECLDNGYFMVSVDLIEKPMPETKKGGKND